jgi:hypothetical protein
MKAKSAKEESRPFVTDIQELRRVLGITLSKAQSRVDTGRTEKQLSGC